MHREEVACFRRLVRTQAAILFQVLHVDADRDVGEAVGGSDRRRHLRQPAPRELAVRGNDAVRVLVAQVPRPQRVVSGEHLRGPAREQRLRPHDVVVEVPVPQASLDDAPARHDPEPCVALRAAERPPRDPIDAAHVTGEQRGHDVQTGGPSDVRHRDQSFEHLGIDVLGLRLERLPEQEHADRVEPGGGDPLEVSCGLRLVERRPPPHRGAGRPVVDAEPERLRCIDAGRHAPAVRPATRR